MKLLSLIHVRSEYRSNQWAVFDTRSTWMECSNLRWRMYKYNPRAVIMHGKQYGRLVEFDVNSAHTWHQAGFLRAVLTFEVQRELAVGLRAIVDSIIADAEPSGNEKWKSLMVGGPRSAHEEALWSSYHHQEFTAPVNLEPRVLLEKARNNLEIHIDEIELMQTDPEYMRQCAVEIKANSSVPYERGNVVGEEWTTVMQAIHWGWVHPLTCWHGLVEEGDRLETTLAELGPNTIPGVQLTREADDAMRLFGNKISQAREFVVLSEALPMLRSISIMRNLCLRYNKSGKGLLWDKPPYEITRDLRPDHQCDRIMYVVIEIMANVGVGTIRGGLPFLLTRLTHELQGVTYNKNMENWLSDMALLDELHSLWPWHQMICHHDPLSDNALPLKLPNSRLYFDQLSSQRNPYHNGRGKDQELSKLLRAFCNSPAPKGPRNISWLRKATEARQHLSRYWQCVREVMADSMPQAGPSTFRPDLLMSFDVSPEHMSASEPSASRLRRRITTRRCSELRLKGMLSSCGSRGALVQARIALCEKSPQKSNAPRGVASIEDDLQKLHLHQALAKDVEAANAETNLNLQIPVKQDTLSVMAKMFSTRAEGTKGVRWTASEG